MKNVVVRSICVLSMCLLCVGLVPFNSSAATYHTFKYDYNGGTADIEEFLAVKDNQTFYVSNATPRKNGYKFEGYHAYRVQDNKYYVAGKGWQSSEKGAKLYQPGQKLKLDSSWTKGCKKGDYIFKASWQSPHSVDFKKSNGTTAWHTAVFNGDYVYINHRLKRNGRYCFGWNVKRIDNNGSKWYVAGQGWVTQSTIDSRRWAKKLYQYGEAYTFDSSWMKDSVGWTSYEFYPVYNLPFTD